MKTKIATSLVLALAFLALGSAAFAAVPDYLLCDAQPYTIQADGEAYTDIMVQLMTDDGQPVKICGVEVVCESQNIDVLDNGQGGAIVSGTTDEFGRFEARFYSAGSTIWNQGMWHNIGEVVCRALQVDSCTVEVKTAKPPAVDLEISVCPPFEEDNHGSWGFNVLADGESPIYVTAQVEDQWGNPVKEAGIPIRFTAQNSDIFYALQADNPGATIEGRNIVVIETDANGRATAIFRSAGSGSENSGTTMMWVAFLGQPADFRGTRVGTFHEEGVTMREGQIEMCAMPEKILADGTSKMKVCGQLRDVNGHIVKLEGKPVSFISEDLNILVAADPTDPNNPAYAEGYTDEYGLACVEFESAGIMNRNNVGDVIIEGDAEFWNGEYTGELQTRTIQIWPWYIELTASPSVLMCDGVSDVTVTAQLLDEWRKAVYMENFPIFFTLSDDVGLTPRQQVAYTDEFGKAKAVFTTVACDEQYHGGYISVIAAAVSGGEDDDGMESSIEIKIVQPDGLVPEAINVYTDQTLGTQTKPFVILADGESYVELTAQLCEWEEGREFCNPVKKEGVRIEFKTMDANIVDEGPVDAGSDGLNHLYAYTDDEGTATVKFYSAGSVYPQNVGCTEIHVIGVDGLLDPTDAQVCTTKQKGLTPNAIWTWAEPAFITADGISHTKVLGQLMWCQEEILRHCGERGCDQRDWSDNGLMYIDKDYYYCKPVHQEDTTVKFESRGPQYVTGRFGEIIYSTTDEFGVATAEFYSAGMLAHNIGAAPIEAYSMDLYEDIEPLNYLEVTTKEKTWPWCLGEEEGLGPADANDDGIISNIEILQFIGLWYNGEVEDEDLLMAIAAWANQDL